MKKSIGRRRTAKEPGGLQFDRSGEVGEAEVSWPRTALW